MTAGLPGTGIGGLFYLLLVFWMPCRELCLLVRGKSSARRWRAIGFFLAMTAAIIVTTWGEAWVLSQLVIRAAAKIGITLPLGQGYRLLAATSIIMSLGSLAMVLLSVQVLRLIVRWADNRRRTTIRTFPDLFPDRALRPGKGFQGQLDRSSRVV
jgi:hypothetical protein